MFRLCCLFSFLPRPAPSKVMEGMETLEQINGQFCDDKGRPYRDIRILHTYVLDDPFDDPPQVHVVNMWESLLELETLEKQRPFETNEAR